MLGLLLEKVLFVAIGEQNVFAGKISGIGSPVSEWMEIYLRDDKVGYSENHISPVGNDYLIHEEIHLQLGLMGRPSVLHAVTRCVVGHQFSLKKFESKMTSGAVTFQVFGRVECDFIHLEIGEGEFRRNERVQLSGRPMIGAAMTQFFKYRRIKVGQSFTFSVFDPFTMAQNDVIMKVKAREILSINRLEYDAFRLEARVWGRHLTFWLDKDGSVLREEGFMGFTMVRSSADRAPKAIKEGGGRDFYKLAAVRVKKKLQSPDKLTFLKIKVRGLRETDFDMDNLNDGRQRFQNGMVEIIKEKIPVEGRPSLQYSEFSGEMMLLLKPEIGIESDDGAIVEKAHEIAGDIKDPVIVSRRLLDWVFQNVEKRPVVTVPSAVEVLRNRVGDCNEHAVLLTALLRASGIPARLCIGLVYTRGMFFYHAWCEIYVGEWISADPTLNQMPADVSHVKLAEGGLDSQVKVIGLMGKIELEILAY